MIQKYDFLKNEIEMDPEKVAEILYKNTSQKVRRRKISSDYFKSSLQKVKEIYVRGIEPFAVTKSMDVNLFKKIFASSLPPESPIYQAVKYWKSVAVFIVTIGPALEESVRSLNEQGKLSEALFLDACGSALADDLAEKTQKRWEKTIIMMKGVDITGKLYSIRYSPGYCQWDVSGQFELFGYAADADVPVSLTQSGMMFPVKSISGVAVLEEPAPDSKLPGSCRECKQKCKYARIIPSNSVYLA